MNLNPLRAAVAPYADLVKIGVLLSALALIAWFFYDMGRDRWQGKYESERSAHITTKDQHAATLQWLADKTKVAADKAKAASQQAAAERKTNDQRFEEMEREAAKSKRDLRAALRAGTVKLRPEWACPAPRPAQGEAATVAGRQDGDAELRAAREGSVLDAIDDGKLADRWIRWLQVELISTRTACGVTP